MSAYAWVMRRILRKGKPCVEAKCAGCGERRIRAWFPQDAMPHNALFGEHVCTATETAFVQDALALTWKLKVRADKNGKLSVHAMCPTCYTNRSRRWDKGDPPISESAFGVCASCSRAQKRKPMPTVKMVPTIQSDILASMIIRRITRLIQSLPPEMLQLIVEDT